MANSSLATYTKISPHKTSPRNHAIDTITIHCMGFRTAKWACDYFAKTTVKCSANYAVGYDGSIGICVEEKDRSWCSSNRDNDNRAVTIEVATTGKHPYQATDKAYTALIELVYDICKRNNITKLVWSTDKKSRVNHLNGCNMTVHRDYANKACPGDYLYLRMADIATKVNAKLSTQKSAGGPYTVQVGAFSSKSNADDMVKKLKGAGFDGYIKQT